MGAGSTNLVWAAEGYVIDAACFVRCIYMPVIDRSLSDMIDCRAKVVFLCAPSITAIRGQSMCDWARDFYVKTYLSHLDMTSTVWRQGERVGPQSGFNGGWRCGIWRGCCNTCPRLISDTLRVVAG